MPKTVRTIIPSADISVQFDTFCLECVEDGSEQEVYNYSLNQLIVFGNPTCDGCGVEVNCLFKVDVPLIIVG